MDFVYAAGDRAQRIAEWMAALNHSGEFWCRPMKTSSFTSVYRNKKGKDACSDPQRNMYKIYILGGEQVSTTKSRNQAGFQ